MKIFLMLCLLILLFLLFCSKSIEPEMIETCITCLDPNNCTYYLLNKNDTGLLSARMNNIRRKSVLISVAKEYGTLNFETVKCKNHAITDSFVSVRNTY